MKTFMDENFLLSTKTAQKLFHDYAKDMPIYDYHCHLSPREIWENKKFRNLTHVWLGGDHYKWRAMRSNGIVEKNITGEAEDYEKFMAFARTMPYCIGNPLYHWAHLELQRYFGVNEIIDPSNAKTIWDKVNNQLNQDDFTPCALIIKSKVKLICTTDDPTDNLEYHRRIKEAGILQAKVLPTFRPDKAINIEKPEFSEWVDKLGQVSGKNTRIFSEFITALEERVEFFHKQGCRISDHALDYVPFAEVSPDEAGKIFDQALQGNSLSKQAVDKYKTYVFLQVAGLYAKHGWAMQIHIGALRNNNSRMYNQLGPDTGFDSINDTNVAQPLSKLLDELDKNNNLAKTILYTLNPAHNYVLGTMLGNFQGSEVPGKIQFGSGWWFNDQKDGMTEQIKALANLGLLGRFVGMLTDSRSFLSYTRHEYFRRILCNIMGQWVEDGEYPYDEKVLAELIQGICFNNAKSYFGIEL